MIEVLVTVCVCVQVNGHDGTKLPNEAFAKLRERLPGRFTPELCKIFGLEP
jgi:hypothetical protein